MRRHFIYAETDGEPHNTITPIARKNGEFFELDLVLRNNITTEEFPLGVYHPHQELHHIKKENIGLIEVMGLAVLPARLKEELEVLKDFIINKKISIAMKEQKSTLSGQKNLLKNMILLQKKMFLKLYDSRHRQHQGIVSLMYSINKGAGRV